MEEQQLFTILATWCFGLTVGHIIGIWSERLNDKRLRRLISARLDEMDYCEHSEEGPCDICRLEALSDELKWLDETWQSEDEKQSYRPAFNDIRALVWARKTGKEAEL